MPSLLHSCNSVNEFFHMFPHKFDARFSAVTFDQGLCEEIVCRLFMNGSHSLKTRCTISSAE